MTMSRAAFTLMELLIVITIIAVLAGLAFPAFGMIKGKARDIQCSNNLRQIAISLEVYRQDDGTKERFPQRLITDAAANDPIGGISLMSWARGELTPKLFLCPHDAKRGGDRLMGRGPMADYSRLYESGMSFMFEASSRVDGIMFTSDDASYFYRGANPNSIPANGTINSWASGKLEFQRTGNLAKDWQTSDPSRNKFGAPFLVNDLPIVRCYHHFAWNPNALRTKKVNNITLGFTTWVSSPFWELDVNPDIPTNN